MSLKTRSDRHDLADALLENTQTKPVWIKIAS